MALKDLIQKIEKDYSKEENSILSKAKEEAAELEKEAKTAAKNYEKSMKEREKASILEEYDRKVRSKKSRMKLEKNLFKREMINRFFKDLFNEVMKLKKKDYTNLYLNFISGDELEKGMTPVFGAKEDKLDDSFLKDLKKGKKKIDFSKSESSDDFKYGIIFRGTSYDVNLSFAEIKERIKEKYLMEITEALFK